MLFNKHILLITPGFALNNDDDSALPPVKVFVDELLEQLPDCKLTIFSLQFPFETKMYYYKRAEVYPFNGQNKTIRKPQIVFKALSLFKKIHKQNRVDIVHSMWLTDTTLLGQIICRKYELKHVATAMGQDVLKSNRYLKLINFNRLILVHLSEFQAQYSNINSQVQFQVIQLGISENNISNQIKTLDVLGVGNLIAVKNYSLFVNVINRLSSQNQNIRAVIIGEGNERIQLEAQIKELGLQENVKLMGKLKRKETLEAMAKAKVFLHTSSFEGFCMVLAEAAACGCHLVSTPVGIAQEIAHIGVNELELANKVQLSLNQTAPTTKRIYAIKNTIEQYKKIYETI
ncbi:MAG: glycosyltransferase [Bacteroidetes bacterium]|nr:glycosyltransferase [Bacteroidota bacterium]